MLGMAADRLLVGVESSSLLLIKTGVLLAFFGVILVSSSMDWGESMRTSLDDELVGMMSKLDEDSVVVDVVEQLSIQKYEKSLKVNFDFKRYRLFGYFYFWRYQHCNCFFD